MKRKLISLAVALLCSVGMSAAITSGSDYLIKNVETGYFLGGGSDWGTHASLHQMPQWFTLTGSGTTYTLDSHQFNNAASHFLGTGLYVDAATTDWEVVETATSGVYTISNGGNYIAGNGTNAVITTTTDGTAAAAKWQLISKNDFVSSLFNATAGSGVDATPYIRDPELKRNGNFITYTTYPWTIKSFDGSANPGNFAQGQNGNNASCAESYHSNNGFKATQKLKGLIPGTYKLSAQAFYRQDGSDEDHYPYLFAQVNTGSVLTSNFPVLSGSENNMVSAYASFLSKSYPVTPIEFTVTSVDDEITIGYACENTSMWCIFGETKLTYHGGIADDSDVTGFISNPSFETGNLNGWTNSDMGTQNNDAFALRAGTYYAERWHNAGDKGVSQELLLPAGLYILTAAINPSNMGATLSAGGQSVTAPANAAAADYSVYFESNGTSTTTISLTATCLSDSWLCVDNFRLHYNPAITAAVGKMNAGVSDAQDEAITAYNSNPSLSTFAAAGEAIAAAEASIEIYTQIAAINAKAALLDDAGIAAYADTQGAYDDGTLTSVAQAQTAYVAAVKSQTSINSDWTGAISNPDFSSSDLSGWTIKTTDGCSAPKEVNTNYKDCEFYQQKFDLSQTLTGMKKGTYEISFQAFQRPGNISDDLLAAYKAGEWTSLATLKTSAERTAVPNIYSSESTTAVFPGTGETWPYDLSSTYNAVKYYVPNSMQGASEWFNTEKGSTGVNYYTTTARAICTEDGGSMYFGFEGDLTSTSGAWLIFANFQLKYIDTDVLVDPAASEELISEATTLATRAMKSSVRDDLQDAIDALEAEKTSGDLYAALESEMTTATASADSYALLATAITNAENYVDYTPQFSASITAYNSAITTAQGVYDAEEVTDCSAAITALTNAIHSAYVSDYTAYNDLTYSYDVLLDDDMREWTTNDWAVFESTEHWNGITSPKQKIYEQTSAEWGQNSWSHSGTETVVLPAGNYAMGIIARANADVTSTMSVTVGEGSPITVALTHKGSTGRGVNTDGEATYADGQTFARNGEGYGWEYRFVPFTVAEENTNVTITVRASSSTLHSWVSLTNPLLRGSVPPNQVIINLINSRLTTLEGYKNLISSATYATFADHIEAAEAASVYGEEDDLNAIAANLLADVNTAKSERDAATTALQTAITNATAARKSANEGTGVFQIPAAAGTTFAGAISDAETVNENASATYTAVTSATSTLNTAKDTYEATTLNVPSDSKRYALTIVEAGKSWDGNAVTFIEGARNDMGGYGIKYLTPANANMNQALKFTAVDGETNTYKISAINVADGGERYITTGSTYDGGNNVQIRTTDDASKASWVKIQATATSGQFQLLNVSDGNNVIANNDNEDMYTASSANFTIAEASQASVTVTCKAGKYGTVIFPFDKDLSDNKYDALKFYTFNSVNNTTNRVRLEEVEKEFLTANTPYIIYNDDSENISESVSGWGIAGATSYSTSHGESDPYLTGAYTAMTIAASDETTANYVLQTPTSGVQAFYKVNAAFTATANKCYLSAPVVGGVPVKAFFFDLDNATGISQIENGELIIDNDPVYNLAGQRVSKSQKGIYVKNGRKVVIK